MSETRVALVSGANRGIGLEIAYQLARLGVMTVMGSRDLEAGRAAADKLSAEGLEPAVTQLDVASAESAAAAVAETLRLFSRIDILINNAGILIDPAADEEGGTVESASLDTISQTFDTNVLGPLRLMQAALPHMRSQGYGRIVNLSSGLGQLSEMGGGRTAYRVSKTALNALTRIAAAETAAPDIKINAMCPGWVRTDMGGPEAARSVEEGAETAVWLATLEPDGPTGGFFRDRKPIAW